jgi:transcriptional regulator with XRE-family HTH domain
MEMCEIGPTMTDSGHQSDRRRKDSTLEVTPDRAAIWGRLVGYFAKKEGIEPGKWGLQSALAAKLGTSQSTVNPWFKGKSLPDLLTFSRFVQCYPLLNVRWLLWEEGPEELSRRRPSDIPEREAGAMEAYADAQSELARIEMAVRDARTRLPGGPRVTPAVVDIRAGTRAEHEAIVAAHQSRLASSKKTPRKSAQAPQKRRTGA